ncbi:MAG: hypothetical protein ACP5IZ_01795 [Thermoprotei archaeon]
MTTNDEKSLLKRIHYYYNKNLPLYIDHDTRVRIVEKKLFVKKYYVILHEGEAVVNGQKLKVDGERLLIEGQGQFPAGEFSFKNGTVVLNGVKITLKIGRKGKHDKLIVEGKGKNIVGLKPYCYQGYICFNFILPERIVKLFERTSMNGFRIKVGKKYASFVLQPNPIKATKIFLPSIKSKKLFREFVKTIKENTRFVKLIFYEKPPKIPIVELR